MVWLQEGENDAQDFEGNGRRKALDPALPAVASRC